MKYIIFRSPEGFRVEVFCAPTTHAEEAKAHPDWTPLSAGFVEFHGAGEVDCYGRSESLHLDPSCNDALVIAAMIKATRYLCHGAHSA